MARAHQIDALQLVSLMIMCRIFSFLAFMPQYWDSEIACAGLLGDILGAGISLVLIIPAFILLKSGDNLLSASLKINKSLGKIVALICFMALIYGAIDTVVQFGYFIKNTSNPGENIFIFVLVFSLVVAYFAFLGLEAISRSSQIFLILVMVGFAIFSALLVNKVEIVNFVSPFFSGYKPILSAIYYSISMNVGAVILIMMTLNTKGSILKGYIAYTLVTLGIMCLMGFFVIGVLGDFAGSKPFPIYTLAVITHTKGIRRLDSIYMYIWVFCALIKTSAFIYLAGVCLKKIFIKAKNSHLIFANTAIAGMVSLLLLFNIDYYKKMYLFVPKGILLVLAVYILPTIVLIIKKLKDKKEVSER